MKKILISLITLFCICTVQNAQAKDYGVYVKPTIIFAIQSSESLKTANNSGYTGSNSTSHGAVAGSIAAGYDLEQMFRIPLRFEVEYAIMEQVKNSNIGSELDQIKIGAQTIFANVYYDFENTTRFTPYVSAGLGVAFLRTAAKVDGSSSFVDTRGNFAWNVGLGLGYMLNEYITIDAGYRFNSLGEARAQSGVLGAKAENFYSHQFGLGARFSF